MLDDLPRETGPEVSLRNGVVFAITVGPEHPVFGRRGPLVSSETLVDAHCPEWSDLRTHPGRDVITRLLFPAFTIAALDPSPPLPRRRWRSHA